MISFAQALNQTADQKRHLLLGNGFSISLFPQCFTYASLLQEAKDAGLFDDHNTLAASFAALESVDFEEVMRALKASSKLAAVYGYDGQAMADDAARLKEILVQAIAGRHPPRPNEITEEQYTNCKAFLSNFIGADRPDNRLGKVFSLNYDLLLYWTVLHDIVEINWDDEGFQIKEEYELRHDDGFRAPEANFDADYVAWDQFSAAHKQSIIFLHGALHLFERGPEFAKLCWERSGNQPLMDQIRAALDAERYPMFVSEGLSATKLSRINRSAYLSKALRSWAECCRNKSAALFVIGHSLDANDDHVLKHIAKGSIGSLYVSIFGDPLSDANQAIMQKANNFGLVRPQNAPLDVHFVTANSLHIWNH